MATDPTRTAAVVEERLTMSRTRLAIPSPEITISRTRGELRPIVKVELPKDVHEMRLHGVSR